MRLLIVILLLFVFSCKEANNIVSGEYDNGHLKIAINPLDNTITGYYEGSTSKSGDWFCSFYFEGFLDKDTFRIATGSKDQFYTQEPEINGKIYQSEPNVIMLKLNETLDADCWRVLNGIEYDGLSFHLSEEKPWKQIRISNSKTFFHSTPNDSTKLKSYLIANDIFFVLNETDKWFLSEYYRKVTTRGFIKKETVKPKRKLIPASIHF